MCYLQPVDLNIVQCLQFGRSLGQMWDACDSYGYSAIPSLINMFVYM